MYDAAKHPSKTVFEFCVRRYGELGARVAALATALVETVDLKPGDRKLIFAETQPNWMVAACAAWRQGATVVTSYRRRVELEATKPVWADSCSVGPQASPSFLRDLERLAGTRRSAPRASRRRWTRRARASASSTPNWKRRSRRPSRRARAASSSSSSRSSRPLLTPSRASRPRRCRTWSGRPARPRPRRRPRRTTSPSSCTRAARRASRKASSYRTRASSRSARRAASPCPTSTAGPCSSRAAPARAISPRRPGSRSRAGRAGVAASLPRDPGPGPAASPRGSRPGPRDGTAAERGHVGAGTCRWRTSSSSSWRSTCTASARRSATARRTRSRRRASS